MRETILCVSDIDTDWFMKQIAATPWGSQSGFAKALGIDQPTLSRMLRGERDMKMMEAAMFARLFDVSLVEVYRRSGIDVDDQGRAVGRRHR